MTDLETLHDLADRLARKDHNFNVKKGPGKGDRANRNYMKKLNKAAKRRLGKRVRIEEKVMTGTDLNFDYYLPRERTAVEVALSIENAMSEWEKDLFKALLAKRHGKPIRKLAFLARAKALKVRSSPSAMIERRFVKTFGIEVVILQLRGRRI